MRGHYESGTPERAPDEFRSLLKAAALVAGVPRATVTRLGGSAAPHVDQSVLRHLAEMVADSGAPLIVADLSADARFQDQDRGGSRFYAGYPLRTPAGEISAVLTLTGDQPSSLGLTQHEALAAIAEQIGTDLDFRSRVQLMAGQSWSLVTRLRLDGGTANETVLDRLAIIIDELSTLANEQAATPEAERTEERTSLRILVADDNVINQVAVRGMLTNLGYAVKVVSDGAEAIAAVTEAHYDAILMDVHMPRVNGIEATRRIRTELPQRWAPIIAMTASVSTEDREACDEAGMDGFLNLPMSPKHLASVLAGVTETLH